MGVRGRIRDGRRTLLAVAVVGVASLAAPGVASAAPTCVFDAEANTLSIGGSPEVGVLVTMPNAPEIWVYHLTANGFAKVACVPQGEDEPTVADVDTIDVGPFAAGLDTQAVIFEPHEFAPGVFAELIGASEIEFDVELEDGQDLLRVASESTEDESWVLGADAFDWNPGDGLIPDPEISFSGVDAFEIDMGVGKNVFSGQGNDATGAAVELGILYAGGADTDRVAGGNGRDEIGLGGGRDLARAAGGADAVTGGAGIDDRLFGQSGTDQLFARDGAQDEVLDCGAGRDSEESARRDRDLDPSPVDC